MKTYELIEHTADVGIKAFGGSLSDCFANAAKGMFDIITDKSAVGSVGQYDITLTAPDIEQLLVDWLSELLFIHSAENIVFGSFNVAVNEKAHSLHAEVFGEPYNNQKHGYGVEVKAVTYHMLKIEKSPAGYVGQVIFDI